MANDPEATRRTAAVTSGGGAHDVDEPEAAAYVPDAETHGSHAAHGDEHAERPLGPLDAAAWGASIIGVAAGGLVGLFLYLAVA